MYRCYATNPLGSDETSCLLYVEGTLEKIFLLSRDKKIWFFVEVRRTRRGHSSRPGEGDTSRGGSRARSPSPLRSSGKDASWRDKLGAGDKPAARDTLDVEKPSRIFFFNNSISHIYIFI
jgi:hypothetical protein